MPFIVAPSLGIKAITWSLARPTQINESAWTGRRTVVANPWHGKWAAHVEMAPIAGEANVLPFRSFLARCKGSINTFRIYATEGAQNANLNVTVRDAAAQGAVSMTLTGLTSALIEGQRVTINGQLLGLVQVAALSAGAQEIWFEPPLRAAAPAATKVVTARPYALVYMANPTLGYSADAGQLYGASFDVSEAILESDGASVPESELVTNGSFGTDASGWTASNATLTAAAGHLRVANTSAISGGASQSINVTPGQKYKIKWDSFAGTAPASFQVGDAANNGDYINSSSTAVGQSATFTPTQSPIFISCRVNSAVSGQYAEFDNISLMEA